MDQYPKHVKGTRQYEDYHASLLKNGKHGPSYLSITEEQSRELIIRYAGTGNLKRDKNGRWLNAETITVHDDVVGISVNEKSGEEVPSTVFTIRYSPSGKGAHIYPDYPSKKGAKAR